MTLLKCWNSGVESKDGAFINLPKRSYACRAPVSSFPSWAHACCRLRFAGQLSIRQSASDNVRHDKREAIGVSHFAIVEPKGLLIAIRLQVERLNAHVCALQCALQEAPEVLQPIGMDVAANIRLRVVDHFVRVLNRQSIVGLQLIRENGRTGRYVLHNLSGNVTPLAIGNNRYLSTAMPLQQAHNDSFPDHPLAVQPLRNLSRLALAVHELRLAAHKGFIGFDDAGKFPEPAVVHRKPKAMEHEPRGFLGHSQAAMDFVGTDAILATDEQPRRAKPLFQSDWGVLKDRPSFKRKRGAFMFCVALPDAGFGKPRNLLGAAARASYLAIWPAQFGHKLAAMLELCKPDDRFLEAIGCFHDSSMRQSRWYVKYIMTDVS